MRSLKSASSSVSMRRRLSARARMVWGLGFVSCNAAWSWM